MRRRGFIIMRFFALSLSGVVLSACEKLPEPLNFQRISVTAGPCNGVCPEYSLSVDENGVLAFMGKRNAAVQAGRAATLSAENFEALKAALRTANIPALQNDYTSAANCPVKSNGYSELLWQVEISGVSKTIRQNLGCASAPDANGQSVQVPAQLNALYAVLMQTTAARAWIYAAP